MDGVMAARNARTGDFADHSRLVPALASLMSEAGACILELAAKGLRGRSKPDASVVTDADEAAEAILHAGIERILPGIPIVAEEAVAHGNATAAADVFVLVDPLDGTREILAGGNDFTVNVALVSARTPILACLCARKCSGAGGDGRAASSETLPGSRFADLDATAIRSRPRPERLVATVSRSHLDPASEAFLAGLPVERRIQVGSAIKFCRLAEGTADVYPRFSPVQEWDAAAGHALLVAAGGSMAAPDGRPLV
jgi:3'(2'), 5'-bisphosphate nucleotidase